MFKINEKIEIVQKEAVYRSAIQDIKDDRMFISLPMSGNQYYMMHSGSSVEFFYSTEKDIIKCKSVVLGKIVERNIEMAVISSPEILERVQRREYFRLPIQTKVRYCLLPQQDKYTDLRDIPVESFRNMVNSFTVDISGGGIKIVSKEPMKRYDKVLLSVAVPEEINVICSVIRCEGDDLSRNYRVALKYERIHEKVRDKIIKFVFDKLREQSKLFK